ncbi:hypothetical protein [Saccharothrix yanglingensis]|uniref:Secreted protein n=1 Tax=Saccharothrix yanglingensis TaxID=659496 RepID=A0ABU0WXN4_9PSEU|nr:hypothetical protein [Saccharothrix yanglingensis]MDQ2584604.1 hypothetical protein [Saccharothrix yanglingensis]
MSNAAHARARVTTGVRAAAAVLVVAGGLTLVAAPAASTAPRVLRFSDLDKCRVAQLNHARAGWTIVQGCTAYVHVNGKPAAWRLMVR